MSDIKISEPTPIQEKRENIFFDTRRLVIIDSNNRPLSGFEVLIFAHNRAIATIPVVKLDNVVAYNR